jgi:hypothetical protein
MEFAQKLKKFDIFDEDVKNSPWKKTQACDSLKNVNWNHKNFEFFMI